jgi:hypothetical protein
MAYTTDYTWVTGEVVTAAMMQDYLSNNIKWLSTDKPMVRAYTSSVRAISTSSYVGIQMDVEVFDNANIHSTTSNTDRFTVPSGAGGKWLVGSQCEFIWSSIGVYRIAAITVDSVFEAQAGSVTFGSATSTPQVCTSLVSAASSAVIRPCAFQDSGGDLNTGNGKNVGGWAFWVGF